MTPAGSVTTNANVEASVAGLETSWIGWSKPLRKRLRRRAPDVFPSVRHGEAKLELARLYVAESERLKTSNGALVPAALDRLRRRHDAFQNCCT